MDDASIKAVAQIAGRSFQSFSEATRSVLATLEKQLPGRVLVAQFDYDEDEFRVVDARGDGGVELEAGMTLPLRDSFCFHMAADTAPRLSADAAEDKVYGPLAMHGSLGVRSYVGVPLELSDGSRVGSVAVVAADVDRFAWSHLELLTVMGRMLAYEWERVNRELELRRLKEQLRDAEKTDPATGVENRQSFLATVERDWLLTQRGTLSSYLVVVELSGLEAAKGQFGDAMGDLFLRDVARALQAVSRKTDAVGRVGDNRFAVLLVGCNGDAGANAFINRMRIALARTVSERPTTVDTAIGFHALADSTSASDALESAERIVHEAPSGSLEGALGQS